VGALCSFSTLRLSLRTAPAELVGSGCAQSSLGVAGKSSAFQMPTMMGRWETGRGVCGTLVGAHRGDLWQRRDDYGSGLLDGNALDDGAGLTIVRHRLGGETGALEHLRSHDGRHEISLVSRG
jgi:hypothetical protein